MFIVFRVYRKTKLKYRMILRSPSLGRMASGAGAAHRLRLRVRLATAARNSAAAVSARLNESRTLAT